MRADKRGLFSNLYLCSVLCACLCSHTHVPAKLHTQACETFMYFALYSVIWAGYGVTVPLCSSGTSQEGLREWNSGWLEGSFLRWFIHIAGRLALMIGRKLS